MQELHQTFTNILEVIKNRKRLHGSENELQTVTNWQLAIDNQVR
jgi:hypothetical protein